MIILNENDEFRSPSFLDRDLLDELNGEKPPWKDEEMKLYMQGVEDNTTVATFSLKVYYSMETGEKTGGKIANMVDTMIERMNKRFEELGALTKVELHCLEEYTWTEDELKAKYGRVGGNSYYNNEERNSADAVLYISTFGGCGWGMLGRGLSGSFSTFGNLLISWIELGVCVNGDVMVHELGHNLGLSHDEMNQDDGEAYYGRVFKEFRFALAAVGDESEPCPQQEAPWEFRSRCFKSFGKYTGNELENEVSTTAKNAKECQSHCAATEGCSFFSFKQVGAACHLSTRDAQLLYEKGVVGGPVDCNPEDQELLDMELVESCPTTRSDGSPCSFPFPYGAVTYVNCSMVWNGQNWCVTENGWGVCANKDCRGGVPGCFKTNVWYSPLNFPGARRSVEISAEACKARCKEDPDCGFFSFWEKDLPKDNGCTLFGDDTVFGDVKETNDYISGPAKCPGEPSEPFKGSHEGGTYCTAAYPCELGEGDCNSDKECKGSLMCGINNCKNSFFNEDDDCCTDTCEAGMSCCSEEFPCNTSCGGHNAQSCAACPQNHGASWCNGDCGWRDDKCQPLAEISGPSCSEEIVCFDKELDPLGAKYDGCVNTTVSGRTCQAWADTSPHYHGYTSLRMEGNNCRNAGYNAGLSPTLWCYTTDPDKRWELCSVPACQGEQP